MLASLVANVNRGGDTPNSIAEEFLNMNEPPRGPGTTGRVATVLDVAGCRIRSERLIG